MKKTLKLGTFVVGAPVLLSAILQSCTTWHYGNVRLYHRFPPPSVTSPMPKPMLSFEGRTNFAWVWSGDLQGRVQDLVEEVGYFAWTNAPEAARYRLVLNVRGTLPPPTGSQYLLAILSGLTFTVVPALSPGPRIETHAELLERSTKDLSPLVAATKIADRRLVQDSTMRIWLVYLFTPWTWVRTDSEVDRMIDDALKDLVVWAGESAQQAAQATAQPPP